MGRGTQGIEVRHRKACESHAGKRCSCRPTYRARVWSPADGREILRSFPTLAAARSWRAEATTAVRRGSLGAGQATTLREAADALIAGMREGSVRNRSGDPYKPSVVRSYRRSLDGHVLPDLGAMRLTTVRRADVQRLCDRMVANGLSPSTVRNAILPLRVIYRRALRSGDVPASPLDHLDLPAVRGTRERIASPAEALALVSALQERDRAIWATALYAGLRLGEIKALRVDDVDLERGIISVERSWDPVEGVVETKSRSGRRRVPIVDELRTHLAEHLLRTGRRDGLVFGRDASRPFAYESVLKRARRAWADAGLDPIGLHECRHTFASICIAAGVNARGLMAYLGHASIQMTFDRYGHLMPGNESEAAALLNAYLKRAAGSSGTPEAS
ncbi:MAG: tyrosine-type recombinase/integrase [Dehalococcoidia bacterium]